MTPEQNETQGFADTQASFPPPSAPAQGSAQNADSGPGQNQGPNQGGGQGRRRRRRKKNKQAGQQAQPGQQGQQANQQANPGNQQAPSLQASAGNQQQPRKQKKQYKFQRQANPGNNYGNGNGNGNSQGGGGRRKNKQRKPQTFVGPMDHSYRAANGNIADSPPSTIDVRNGTVNGNIASYAESHWEATVPIREDAPTRIFCFIDDLFFVAKINEVSRKTGVKVGFLKGSDKETIAQLTDAPEEERPSLIIFDLNNLNAKPLTVIPKLKAKLKRGTSVVGFLSHVQGELKGKAIEAGCDTVMPRSAFSQNLPNLLRRYGIEEEEVDEMGM